MFRDYADHDATGLAELIARREVTPLEVLDAAIARAERVDPQLKAICIPMLEIARQRARGNLSGPFAGVPFLLKDILQHYAGVPTTAGCRASRDWTPTANSQLVNRYLDAGLVIFGKTATPEFGLKAETSSLLWGPTRNPWDLARVPGGSSGGAAAAVAAGIVPAAGASDGGGSIRIPAAYCGLFGLKPSRSRVPSDPPWPDGYWDGACSEHALTRSVRDSAGILDAIAIGAPLPPPPTPYAKEIQLPPGRLRIGFSTQSPIGNKVHPECVRAVERTVELLKDLKHEVVPAQPNVDGAALVEGFVSLYYREVANEISKIKARSGASDDAFELDTRMLALVGNARSPDIYKRERARWDDYARDLGAFHQQYDLYLTPTTAEPPNRIGELDTPGWLQPLSHLMLTLRAGRFVDMMGTVKSLAVNSLKRVPFTQLSNLTGTPSMSVPLHWARIAPDEPEIPFGVQFVAKHGDEATLFRLAAQLEAAQPWSGRRPAP
ncbi:amidase [Bradyrhizobium prioriisuperbiae]|uniref:amidase n=1 Tax=Bradyrhizobium prioriisuperbiae TaxID=2854389 RepID=UPI0028F111B1|nr:amidase [Bradyrhizobium prioritasuperba]